MVHEFCMLPWSFFYSTTRTRSRFSKIEWIRWTVGAKNLPSSGTFGNYSRRITVCFLIYGSTITVFLQFNVFAYKSQFIFPLGTVRFVETYGSCQIMNDNVGCLDVVFCVAPSHRRSSTVNINRGNQNSANNETIISSSAPTSDSVLS